MNIVTTPSARERFTPRELSAAYADYTERGPQYADAKSGLKAALYRFGAGTLVVCEKPEVGVVMLTLEEQESGQGRVTFPGCPGPLLSAGG